MIIPNGKNKHQVNQGGFKNESIWDSSIFNKLALAPTSTQDEAKQKNDSPEAKVMNDSNSLKMNPSKIPDETVNTGESQNQNFNMSPDTQQNETTDMGNGQNKNWKFDPQTGAPLSGMTGQAVYEKAHEAFAGYNLSVQVKGDIKGSNWTVTVSPNTSKTVAKL